MTATSRWRLKRIMRALPITVELKRRIPPSLRLGTPRYDYQVRHLGFDPERDKRVLDIGAGADPFPHATMLLERFLGSTAHRKETVKKDSRPFVVGDIHHLPFRSKAFDFVYCSHVLEHVDDPLAASLEIMRIGERGYIETPTLGKDVLFGWASGMHKWHVVGCGDNLCFFEYTTRLSQGMRSSAWIDIVEGRWHHPLIEAFVRNPEVFNVMFSWSGTFGVFVFRLDGSVDSNRSASMRTGSPSPPQ